MGNVSMVNGGSAGGLRATSFDKADAGGARGASCPQEARVLRIRTLSES